MELVKKYLPWTVRILLAALFIFSGYAKMFPIWPFEKQLVDLGITSWCAAPYLSRLIIALEIAIAFALLQNNYLKSLVIPATALLLVAFNVHLGIEMYKFGPNTGNCGCFGQVIEMTPLEAFIKNIVTLGLLYYLWRVVSDRPKGDNLFLVPFSIYLTASLGMFMFFPFCPCDKDKKTDPLEEVYTPSDTLRATDLDSGRAIIEPADDGEIGVKIVDEMAAKDILEKQIEEKNNALEEKGPAKKVSKFASYPMFAGKKVNIDEGKKIICMFASGCDHCQDAIKAMTELKKAGKLSPDIYIYFMDEEPEKIPEFFKIAGKAYPYQVMDIPKFWTLIGNDANTPGVFCLWNGNVIKRFEGQGENEFKKVAMEKVFSK
jgi:thiol-disulfide isomerase/thioredoxin/uncharacterized membrane protein YphA (DoxX/SURF4 family)